MSINNPDDLDRVTKNFPSHKIICINNVCPDPDKYGYNRITPQFGGDIYSYGKILFHKKGGTAEIDSSYLTKAGLFGAIFSDSKTFYECQMSRAFYQLGMKKDLHIARLKILATDPKIQGTDCENIISSAQSYLIGTQNTLGLSDAATLYAFSKQMSVSNQDLQYNGCPAVY